MMNRTFLSSVAILGLALATPLAAQDQNVTVQLRSGEKIAGTLEDLEGGVLYVRVSLDDQRKLPIGEVALIDRVGAASGLPATEITEAKESQHLLLTTSGTSMRGTLVDVMGGQGSPDEDKPRVFVFRDAEGKERRLAAAEVGRVYLGNYPFKASAASGEDAVPAGAIRVDATAGWVPTYLVVRSGERIEFVTTGEVTLSQDAADKATAAGNDRRAANAPLPLTAAGALIGKIGPNGAPFGIGDQKAVPMPADGQLFLSVNDDERSDNAGAFVVIVRRSQS